MSKKEDVSVLSLDELEKSWNDSKSLLKSLLDDDSSEKLEKSKDEEKDLEKSKDEDADDADGIDDEEAEDDGEEEDEDDGQEKLIKKSLEDDVASDEEAAAAMDVEPFLRSLTKSISNRFAALEAANAKLTKALAKSLGAFGDQNMMIASTVQAIAEAPVGSRSVIRKSMDKYPEKAAAGNANAELLKSMSVDQVLEKAVRLSKAGKLTSLDVAKINNRLNKGVALNDEYVNILSAKEEK